MTSQIDWKTETKKYFDDFITDLVDLLKINSVRNDDEATDEFPVGPGPAKALDKVLEIGNRDGFNTQKFQNWAGHIEYGEGDEILGILGHVDVVPVGDGWDNDPFYPVIKDGRLYARGASDDKGPTIAAYYALKMIKDLGVPVNKKIRLILGTDEESDWQGLNHYLSVEKTPDFGFSPDAEFPIINGEKGNYTVRVEVGGDNSGSVRLEKFEAGLRANMVPQIAQAHLSGQVDGLKEAFETFIEGSKVRGSVEEESGKVVITVNGKASHGSKPENGVNAGTYLANFLKDQNVQGSAQTFLEIAGTHFHDDPFGEKVGVNHEDDVMGVLSSNPGIINFDDEDGGSITVNMRYPKGITEEDIFAKYHKALGEFDVELISEDGGKAPHYVPGDDPLVKTLLDVYERQTGEKGFEQVIGGGTYARLMERGVAYGALFPYSVDTMHQANEYMELEDLEKSIAIYAEAIYELVK